MLVLKHREGAYAQPYLSSTITDPLAAAQNLRLSDPSCVVLTDMHSPSAGL